MIAEQKVKTIEQLLLYDQAQGQHASDPATAMAQALAQQRAQVMAAAAAQQRQEVGLAMAQAQVLQQAHAAAAAAQHMAGAPAGQAAAAGEVAVVPAPEDGDKAEPKKKRKLVQIDADGNILKKAPSGYNMYMTESMKELVDGEKPKFGDVASKWKDLTTDQKEDWNKKAKDAAPKAAGEKWIDVDVDEPKKKKKKREKSGYNLYVADMMVR